VPGLERFLGEMHYRIRWQEGAKVVITSYGIILTGRFFTLIFFYT
jgi:hypothetical protein